VAKGTNCSAIAVTINGGADINYTTTDVAMVGTKLICTFTAPATSVQLNIRGIGSGTRIFSIDNWVLYKQVVTSTAVNVNVNQYRFGHNAQEKDNEQYGNGNLYTAEFWEYDPRLCRRWNTDPVVDNSQSPYCTFNNNPIYFADPSGLAGDPPTKRQQKELDRIDNKLERIGEWNKTHDKKRSLTDRESDFYATWHNWDFDPTEGGTWKQGNHGGYASVQWEGSYLQMAAQQMRENRPGEKITFNGNTYRITPIGEYYNSGYLDLGLFMHQQKNMAEGYFLMAKILEIEAGFLAFGCFGGGGVTSCMENRIAITVAQRTSVLTRAPLSFATNVTNKTTINFLSKADYTRIKNAAIKINKEIHLVGSRANGTSKFTSDWDYVIEEISSKDWSKIKNSLPGSSNWADNIPSNIDLFTGALNKSRPFITFTPK
jgi:hypothetical protein